MDKKWSFAEVAGMNLMGHRCIEAEFGQYLSKWTVHFGC
jgi:hypothetical protein